MTATKTNLAVLAVMVSLGLAGCSQDLDPRQAQVCRAAAVALSDSQDFRVLGQAGLPAVAALPSGVRIDLQPAADGAGLQWLECRFAPGPPGSAQDLVDVATDKGHLPEPRLFVLKRFWLATQEAAGSDPQVAEQVGALPTVPPGLAYALQQAIDALPNAAIYSLLAAAYSLVYGLFGRINLAFGEIAAIGGLAALTGASSVNLAPAPAVLAIAVLFGLWATALHGAAIERLVLWPLRRSSGQQGLVATIGLALFLEEYLRLIQGSQAKWIGSILASPIRLAHAEGFTVTVTPIGLVLVCGAGLASAAVLALLQFTSFGRNWRATADDPGAAALFGIDPQSLSMKTFVLASVLAGLAGASVSVFYGSLGFTYTTTIGLKALIAAIVGGIGSVPGAFLGGLAIASVEAAWSAYFPIVYRDFTIDVLLVATLVLRPGGLFGYRDLLPRRV